MNIVNINTTLVKQNKYNPTIRTDKQSSSYKNLKKSILENGLIVPVILDSSMKLIDGHRRLSCFLDLQLPTIPAIINPAINSLNYDKTFVIANENSMKIDATQETERYLMGAKTISNKVLKSIKLIEDIGGKNSIRRIVSMKKSPSTYVIGINMYCSYTKQNTRKAKRQCLYWMFNVGTAYMLKTAMSLFIPSDLLQQYVEQRKPMVAEWAKR